jgi:hypothetical protein
MALKAWMERIIKYVEKKTDLISLIRYTEHYFRFRKLKIGIANSCSLKASDDATVGFVKSAQWPPKSLECNPLN